MFKLDNVSLIYDMDKEQPTYALSRINLEIKPKVFYGIIGPSGSGKSSLLYILSGITKPSSGKVYYKDREWTCLDEEESSDIRLKEFGFIFQKHLLLPYINVVENVLVPVNSKKKEAVEEAESILMQLGLEKELKKKPSELSGGQCQKVAIARALINHPKVIFADEMTASLDYKASEKVLKLFDKVRKETTILFVTHDERMLQGADEIIKIRDGKLEDMK